MPARDETTEGVAYGSHSEMRRALLMTQAQLATVGHSRGRAQALIDLVDTMIHHAHPWSHAIGDTDTPPQETRTDTPTAPGLYWAFFFNRWQVLRLFRRARTDELLVQRHGSSTPSSASEVQTWGPRVPDFVPLNNEME